MASQYDMQETSDLAQAHVSGSTDQMPGPALLVVFNKEFMSPTYVNISW